MKTFKEMLEEAKKQTIKVPETFKDLDALVKWFVKQPIDGKFSDDLVDPETGEVLVDKGATKKKAIKDRGSFLNKVRERVSDKEYAEMQVPEFDGESDLKEFTKFYSIVFSTVAKKLDHPEEMKKAGYDISSKMPSIIKRKDGLALTQADKYTLEDYGDWYAKENLPFDVGLDLHFGGKLAEFYPDLKPN